MANIGRNSPCPCGSGKKYKRCCRTKEINLLKKSLPSGRFQYKSGSYGDPSGYMPSIMGYKETGTDSWTEHLCLVKPDMLFDEENSASDLANEHLSAARQVVDSGGTPQEFALMLRHNGYKSVSDFKVV